MGLGVRDELPPPAATLLQRMAAAEEQVDNPGFRDKSPEQMAA
jgi:hypothetical protein